MTYQKNHPQKRPEKKTKQMVPPQSLETEILLGTNRFAVGVPSEKEKEKEQK